MPDKLANETIIIGASAAGLACAARLQKLGKPYLLLEKSDKVGQSWRNHYDRLHLHTDKKNSSLPFVSFEADLPQYPARQDVIKYLENYADKCGIKPQFNITVKEITKENGAWSLNTSGGKYETQNLIIATGNAHTPTIPNFRGLESFKGEVLHSSTYKNGAKYKGKKVLLVGFGNSACEQAICLSENGAYPAMSVRSAVNVLPRDILGVPILDLGTLTSILPAKWADKINRPLISLIIGDITKYGLKKSKMGAKEQIEKTGRIPLLDIGTMKLIKEGKISIYEGIKAISGNEVTFNDGKKSDFEAIILGTGYSHGLETLLPQVGNLVFEELKRPIEKRKHNGENGLYFCGFFVSPNGMLREITRESKLITDEI